MKFSKWTTVRVLALVAVVAFVWCLNNDRLAPQNWSLPVDYSEDSLQIMGWIQSAAEGDFTPFLSKTVHRLGAPYQANWNDWPLTAEELFFVHGQAARWLGLFPAANLAVLLGYICSALGFYAVCRLLKFRWEWSFIGAVLFAFTYFHAYRHLHHLIFVYSYTVPFALLTGWLVAFSRGMQWRDWRPWLCLGTTAVMSLANVYNLNLLGQLVCLALLVQLVSRRRRINLLVGGACLAILVIGFLASHIDTFAYEWAYGHNPDCVKRGYYETELFGLKPVEMFLPPPTHHLALFHTLTSRYLRDAWLKGELFSPYLGVVAIAGLLWMVVEAWQRLGRSAKVRPRLPIYGVLVLWILWYAIPGGLNCMASLIIPPLFRGTNRFSIFISALALMFVVSRLSLWSRGWQPQRRYVLAGVLLLVGLFDQLPRAVSPNQTQAIAQVVESDRKFCQAMESKLPARSMVFELPALPYPESTPVGGVQSYDPLRPYLLTHTLRFSFGSNKGRPREDWMKTMEQLPGDQLVSTLEKYGFGALYLNRKGYPDQGQALLGQIAKTGRSEVIEDAMHEQVCVLLKPSPTPELPPIGDRALFDWSGNWFGSTETTRGTQHYVGGSASLVAYSGHKTPVASFELKCMLGSFQARQVRILANGREIWNCNLAAGTGVPIDVHFDAKPGKNVITFSTDVTEPPSKYNPVPRDFVVVEPLLTQSGGAYN